MEARNCTIQDMEKALKSVNRRYKGNVEWYDIRQEGKRIPVIRFRLRVKNSRGPGAKLGFSGRHTVAACWHVHGHFFEELLKIAPDAEVVSRGIGVTVTRHGGNWQDMNIGSMMQPLMFSEACECRE